MKNNYEVRAKKFIRQFYSYIKSCKSYRDFYEQTEFFNYENKRKVIMSYGLTRIAFITSDYVVKINWAKNSYNFEQFGDCESEIELYEEAEQDGYEYLFAKIERYEYMEHCFYIMPRIYGIGKCQCNANTFLTEDEEDWISSRIADLHCKNYGWKNNHVVIFDYACSA